MTPLKIFFAFIISLSILFLGAISEAAPREREKGMQKQRGGGPRGGQRGNENSLRPQRVRIDRPDYFGNGCPAGSMSVIFAGDYLSFSILFSEFTAESAAGRGGMTCDTIIPVELPDGMQMEITRVDFRGFANLPEGARASFRSVFNFREGRGADRDRLVFNYNFQGPLLENYTLSTDSFSNGSTETSPCGGSVNLRVMSQLQVMVPRGASEPAMMTLDSADGAGNAVYYVNWKACGQQRPPTPPPVVRPQPQPPRPGGPPRPPGTIRQPVPPRTPARPQKSPEQCYLERYTDICQNSRPYCKDPAAHYRNHGRAEGRVWGCN
jgi:hypothetical protein